MSKFVFSFVFLAIAAAAIADDFRGFGNGFGGKDRYEGQRPPGRSGPNYPNPNYPNPSYPPLPPAGSINEGVLKQGIMTMAQEILSYTPVSQASDGELAKVQEYLSAAKLVLVATALPPNVCAVLFSGDNYTGQRVEIGDGPQNFVYNLSYYNFNDAARSFQLKRGCRMGLWKDKNSGGPVEYYTTSMTRIMPEVLYHEATTVKCSCDPRDQF